MEGLFRVEHSDRSNIVVTYYSYQNGDLWTYSTLTFEKEKDALDFIKKSKKDFNKRLIGVEKRVITYEKFVGDWFYETKF